MYLKTHHKATQPGRELAGFQASNCYELQLPDPVGLRTGYSLPGEDGLLAKSGLPFGLMSMSTYGKPTQQQQHQQQQQDYDTRPSPVQHLHTPSQSTSYYSSQALLNAPPQRSPLHPHATQQHQYIPGTLPKPSYHHMPYDNSAALMPEIVEWSPHIGTEGTQFTVYLQSSVDLKTGDRHFRLSFGSFRCNSTGLTKSEDRPGTYYVTCDVPPSTQTGWPSPQVTVYLHIEDKHGDELNTIPVGEFTYSDAVPQTTYSTPNSSRKRKLSNDPEENIRGPIKRTASQPAIRPKGEDYGNMYPYQAQSGVGGTPYTSQFPPHASPRTYPYGSYPATSVAAHSAVVAQQHLQSWPHSYPSASASASAPPVISPPSASSKPSSGPHTLPSPDGPNPPLVRTSTLQQGQTSSAGNTGGSSSANTGPGFNPYGIYPSSAKAVLNIEGDLDSVATIPWNPEEMENRRKLVQFWRHQKGSQITSRFSVIAQNERQPNSICISCIYWAEKGECYVTSVDCIYLLESLVAVRFTVEEKNRIRRNLEGFRPLTVSKAKADSENFFKLIMAFPNPKPRNIEKDVKVFPWKILASALKKIIGKYSASYSSTAALIPQTPSSAYPGSNNEASSASNEAHSLITPSPSNTDSASSAGLSSSLTGTAGSPVVKQQPPSKERSPVLRHPIPSDTPPQAVAHSPTGSTTGQGLWQQQQHHSIQQHPKGQGLRQNWGELGYVDPASSPVGAQGVHYTRGNFPRDDRSNNAGTGHPGGQVLTNTP